MINYLIFGSAGAISGGILYSGCNELYKIYIIKSQKYILPIQNVKQYLNRGFIVGLGVGISRAYTGKPLIDIVINSFFSF